MATYPGSLIPGGIVSAKSQGGRIGSVLGTIYITTPPVPPLAAPYITNLIPTVQGTLAAETPISFDVVALNGLLRSVITIQFDKMLLREIVHDGFAFGPAYLNARCSVAAITDGLHYVIWRSGGWPASPTLLPLLSDLAGLENV